MGKSLAEMAAEIRQINIEHGWRPAEGGPGDRTFGDFIALLHSEVSEALEAYRNHELADATRPACGRSAWGEEPCPDHGPRKPEGVGSELADVLIRLLDMCDVFGIVPFDMDCELADVAPLATLERGSFGDHMARLHREIARIPPFLRQNTYAAGVLRVLVSVADHYGIDLTAEYERKVAYNRTRAFRHGGRAL